jgi:hypothetical protein
MKSLIIFACFMSLEILALSDDLNEKTGSNSNSENSQDSRNSLDVNKLSPAELGKLNAYDVLFAGFKNASTNQPNAKNLNAKIAFLLKQPFRDLLYDIQIWHDDGVKELAFIQAVKEVQKKFGEKTDGNLTFSQYQRLEKIANIYKTPKEVYIGGNFRVVNIGEKAFVTGTLEIVDEEIANPINYHSMILDKHSKICRDSNLYVQEHEGFASGIAIYLDETNYEIISWDQDEVICKKEYSCRSEKIIINFKSKSVDIITTNRDGEDCKDFPRLKSPRVSRIVKPFNTRMTVAEKNNNITRPFVADSAKERLKELFRD